MSIFVLSPLSLHFTLCQVMFRLLHMFSIHSFLVRFYNYNENVGKLLTQCSWAVWGGKNHELFQKQSQTTTCNLIKTWTNTIYTLFHNISKNLVKTKKMKGKTHSKVLTESRWNVVAYKITFFLLKQVEILSTLSRACKTVQVSILHHLPTHLLI